MCNVLYAMCRVLCVMCNVSVPQTIGSYVWDAKSGYYYDQSSGLYYDPKTKVRSIVAFFWILPIIEIQLF